MGSRFSKVHTAAIQKDHTKHQTTLMETRFSDQKVCRLLWIKLEGEAYGLVRERGKLIAAQYVVGHLQERLFREIDVPRLHTMKPLQHANSQTQLQLKG